MSRARRLLAAAALLPLACASGGPKVVRQAEAQDPPGTAVVGVRLEVMGGTSTRVLEFGGLTLIAADREVPVTLQTLRVQVSAREQPIARGTVAAGRFRGLRVIVDRAWSNQPDQGGAEMLLSGKDTVIPMPIELQDGEALDLALRIDLRLADDDGIEFRPRWSLGIAGPLLPAEMLLAADGRSGGILVVDRKRMRVHRTLLPGQAVAGLVLGRTTDELLAVDSRLDEAVLIDLARGEERDRRGLQAGGRIHWAVGLPGGRGLAVAQSGRRAIEIIEHPGFLSLGAIGTGRPPERMVASARLNRLYALIPESDELLVLAPSEMQVVARSSLEDQPVDLDLDRREERLAVACAGSGRVLVLDAASLEILQSIQVGPRLRAVIFDDRSERLFVATDLPPSVQAIELGTGQVTSIGRLPSGAADLELDPDGRLIWAACPDASRLVALDRFSLRLQASIEVPARPDRLLAPGRATR